MKSDRRHELQENSLAKFIENLPVFLHLHGNKLLLGVTLVLAIIVVLNWRASAKRTMEENFRSGLTVARQSIGELDRLTGLQGTAAENAQLRSQRRADAESALDVVINNAEQPAVKAEAILARGDLYWTLANLPDLPGATTQPSLQLPQPRDQALTQAAASYQRVINEFSTVPGTRVIAQLGLAAVNENLGKFDEATRLYTAVRDQTEMPMYAEVAREKLALLPMISKPRKVFTVTTRPTTAPALPVIPFVPPAFNLPGTQPATQPG